MTVVNRGDLEKLFRKDLGTPLQVVDAWEVDRLTQESYPIGVDLPADCPLLDMLIRVPSDEAPEGIEYRAPKGWTQGWVEGPKGEGIFVVDMDGKSWNVSSCVGLSIHVAKPLPKSKPFPWPLLAIGGLAVAAYVLFFWGK